MAQRGILDGYAAAGLALAAILAAGSAVAMGGSPKPAPMPSACDALKAIDTTALLGNKPDFSLNNDNKSDLGRMTTCTALDAKHENQLGLLLRAAAKAPKEDAATLRKQFIDSVNSASDTPMTTENLKIGDAAVWTKEDKQLTFWTHKGQLMMILSGGNITTGGAGSFPLPNLEAVARKIVAAYP
jgi:hypothetical protein